MAETTTVHHPDRPDSTMTVTTKAFTGLYAGEGYVRGAYGAAEVDANDVARLQRQLAEAQAQLAAAQQVQYDDDAPPAPAASAVPPRVRAPRKRTRPTKAAPPAPPAMVTRADVEATLPPAPGPADVPSTSPDED